MLENLFSFWVIICLGLAGIYFYNARKYLNNLDREKLDEEYSWNCSDKNFPTPSQDFLKWMYNELTKNNSVTYPDNPRISEFSYLGG